MTIRLSSFPHTFFLFFLLFSIFKFSRQFSEETIKFAVSEDAPINTIIGRLEAQDGYTYRLSRGNSKIHFDDQKLELSTSSLLDRESEDAIDMLIITSPPSIIHVLIEIKDVNDNPPKFPVSIQKIEIPETAPNGWRVAIAGATDPDAAENGTIGGYQLEEEDDVSTPFRIVESEGFVFLEVTGKLDRETRDLYSIRVTAKDQGTPSLSASCLLNIFILDTNDNPPDFGIRSIHLNWNGQPSETIFVLNATDSDSGANAFLNYRILPPGDEFFLIKDNALVTRNNTLQECSPRCELVVEARDSGVPPLSTTLNVEVSVEFGNEHEPNLNIRFYPSDFPFIVVQPEDVNGKTLAILSLTDPDGPLGDNSSIWISGGNQDNVFSLLSRQSINILTLKNAENAKKELYLLEFSASDDQSPTPKIAKKTLQIFFKRHEKPAFFHVAPEFHVELEKDTVPGSFVTHVVSNCTEMCIFELSSDVFKIDTSNGIIVTSSDLPDDVTSYHLPVRIRLPPPSTKFLETDVFVKISNIPKNLIRSQTTVHLAKAYTFATWQNVTVGTVVGRLPKGQVYSTSDGESELGVFPDGAVFVGKKIQRDFMTLQVILEDRNTTQKSLVTVIMKHSNEHTPSCEKQEFHVAENTPLGSVIGKLYSEDPDYGADSVVSFSSGSDLIHVDSSGIVKNLKKLDAEKLRNFTFSYEVVDYGSPKRRQNCTAIIFIDDVNDNAPEFSSPYYTAKIPGSLNFTVSIVYATDKDIEDENRKIHYYLKNYGSFFQVEKESGKVTTTRTIPKTWKRLNLTVEAVNSMSPLPLRTESFILIDVTSSEDLRIRMTSEKVIRIYKNDEVGVKVGKFKVEISEPVTWRIEDSRFFMRANGDIILNQKMMGSQDFEVIVSRTSSEGLTEQRFEHQVEMVDSERLDPHVQIVDLEVSENQTEIWSTEEKDWMISRIVSNDINQNITFENGTLFSTGPVQDTHVFLKANETFKILHLYPTFQKPSESQSPCQSAVHLITPPATVSLPCDDVSLLNNSTNFLQIHEGSLLIPSQTELISHVDLISSTKKMKPFMFTLIKDQPTEEVKFASNNVLMLLSSVHNIGSSFGRVTAESAYRIRYYLVGTRQVSIDADTGELFLRERFYHNLNDIQIIAVIPTGIAKARVTIEVIEDRLQLSTNNFVIIANSRRTSSLGKLQVGRDDVMVDIVDDNFYSRKFEIFAKKHFVPTSRFYDLEGIVKKGKLSTAINVMIFFAGNSDDVKENELRLEVEENSPSGTAIGVVPNHKTSKFRLVDPKCGLLIDQDGIIRTTAPFDRENFSLLKTKMIEPKENRIWDILVFIGDVNDNKPKITNAPGNIILQENRKTVYQLDWEDADDFATDVKFSVVDGDFYNHLEVLDSGRIKLNSFPQESFNATIRIYDNVPPFPVNFDDVTVEFLVDQFKRQQPKCEDNEIWLLGTQSEVVGKMESSDLVTWRILPDVHSHGEFEIDPISGEVRRGGEKSLFNGSETFDLRIQVISYDGMSSGFCSLKIHVEQEQNTSDKLEFDKQSLDFKVSENAERGMEVGRIRLTEPSDNVVFRTHNDYNFTLSPFDGTIFTNSPLDFEKIKTYTIQVVAERPGSSESVMGSVTIHVTDENDEAPRFITGDVVNIWVTEEQKTAAYPMIIGSSIAEDLDEDGVVTYSVLSGNTSLFAVNSTSGDIILLSPLDREDSNLHDLMIEAKDSGVPSLTATSRILIHVEDVNDNSPVFEQTKYFVSIPENLPIGSKVLKVHAEDRDLNPELVYSMDSEIFRMDPITGWITVSGRIDREERDEYEMIVIVKDSNNSAQCQVSISIDDVNDNSPVIENQNLDIFVPSDVSQGALLHVIDAHDPDRNSQLKFEMNGTDSGLFEVAPDGEIILKQDGLTTKSYFSIDVTVSDGKFATSSEYTFYLHPHQEFPVWTEKIQSVKVREHEAQELAVFKARGQGIRYSIVSKCQDFLIDTISGVLSVKDSLDREQQDSCAVFVVATKYVDNKPLSVITKLLVTIIDINDNSPIFEEQVYHFNISENAGPSTIGRIKARDLDDGDNSRLRYAIVSGDPNHEFRIMEAGGLAQLEAIRDLDRESQASYQLVIEAIDNGKPRRRGNTTVLLKVIDEDDNAPRFSRIFHVELPEDAKVGDFVIQLSASDADETQNHRFALEGDDLPFRVEENTGKVFVNGSLDFEKKPSYRIKVRLTDGAWLIETSFFVNLKDINDNPPVFQENEYFFIAQDKPIVGRVIATDRDSGANGKVHYSINSPFFRINASSGEITKLRPLPKRLVSVEITASDNGVPRLQSKVICHVADQEQYNERVLARIRETARIGDVVGTGISDKAKVMPRVIAEINSKKELVLKKPKNVFWILEDKKLTEYLYVPDEKPSESQNLTVNFSDNKIQLDIPECSNFVPQKSPKIQLESDGALKLLKNRNSTIKVMCSDGVWPRRNRNVTISIVKSPKIHEDFPIWIHRMGGEKGVHQIEKSIKVNIPSEVSSEVIVWKNNDRVPFFMEKNGVLTKKNGNLVLIPSSLQTNSNQTLEIFDTEFKRSQVSIHRDPDSDTAHPSCPFFSKQHYFIEKGAETFTSEILDFGLQFSKGNKDCKIKISSEEIRELEELFDVHDSKLIALRRLIPGTYQLHLQMRSSEGLFTSECHVVVMVASSPIDTSLPQFPRVIFIRENSTTSPIHPLLKLPTNYSVIQNSEFEVTDSGAVWSRQRLRSKSIWKVPVVSKSKEKIQEFIRVLLDDVVSLDPIPKQIDFHVIKNTLKIHDVTVLPSRNCTPRFGDVYEITLDCHVITPNTYSNISIPIEVVNSSTWHVNILNSPLEDAKLEKNAVELEFYGKSFVIARLLSDLRSIYSDMKIHMVCAHPITPDIHYVATIAIIDRNDVIITASEARRTLSSFLEKHRPNYLEFVGFRTDQCDDVICKEGSTCQTVSEVNGRLISRSQNSSFDLPDGELVGKCFCTGKECLMKKQKDEVIMRKLTGKKNCKDFNCGTGSCVMENNRPVCRCPEGFESLYECSKSSDVFRSNTDGYLDVSVKNETILKCDDGCKGIQQMELDFRTIGSDSELIRVQFGRQTAVVEILFGTISFSLSDEFTRPIQTKVSKPVNDGNWHRLLFQMSENGKKISIQVDGRGKEVKSRVPLPMMFSSEKIRLLMPSSICFRRLLVQNQFIHPVLNENHLFHVASSTSSVSSTCQFDSSQGTSRIFTNTTTIILLAVLGIISIIALSVCLLVIRRKKVSGEQTDRSGWKKATEIDAFAIPRGHVNRTMVKSPDDYDSGYETQMKSTSSSSYQQRYQRNNGHINMAYL